MFRACPVMNYWRVLFSCAVACFAVPARSQVVFNEIHYDPPVKTELIEFVELYNSGVASVTLDSWRIDGGVHFTFPAGSTLAPGGYAVVAENPTALKARFAA